MTPSIITSRAAQNHLDGITVEHSKLMSDMQTQQIRVQAYNQQKEQESQLKQQQDQEVARSNQQNQEKIAFEREKMALENQYKQQEYDMRLLEAIK